MSWCPDLCVILAPNIVFQVWVLALHWWSRLTNSSIEVRRCDRRPTIGSVTRAVLGCRYMYILGQPRIPDEQKLAREIPDQLPEREQNELL